MNFENQQVYTSATSNMNSFGSTAHNSYPVDQQADSSFANLQPMQIPVQVPPMGNPQFPQLAAFDPNMQHQPDFQVTQQPQLYPQLIPLIPMEGFNQMPMAPAVYPYPQQFPLPMPYSGVTPTPTPMGIPMYFPAMSPAPPFQPVEVPANMQVYEAVHGQVFPVMKTEEASFSNASSESGLTSNTPPPPRETPPVVRQLPSAKRSPPGFEKPKAQPTRKQPEKQELINYARIAAKKTRPPSTVKSNLRSTRVDKISQPKRETAPPKLKLESRSLSTGSNQGRRPKKKFGFRSKQNMIDKVYESISRKYEALGILASADEVLRGDDTIRLHVKKFKALKRIQEALEAVEREPSVRIAKVSVPLSMKNQFQKKGFLVYTQLADVSMVATAKRIFQQFEEFRKCEVARQTTDNSARSELPMKIVEDKPTSMRKKANGFQILKPLEGESDPFCGSLEVCGLSNEEMNTGSPELYPVSKALFEDDDECGLGALDLTALPMCPKISIGEAGQ